MIEPSIPIAHGLRLVPTPHMADVAEDWSKVRSPGRAQRRRKAGKPQRITQTVTPQDKAVIDHASGTVYAHPVMIQKLRARLEEEKALDRNLSASPLPAPHHHDDEALFASAHIGIWRYETSQTGGARHCQHKAFDRFPDLMGGDRSQLAIYEQARYSGSYVRWNLPTRLSDRDLGAPTQPTCLIETVTFRIERMSMSRRPTKDVLCFADAESEALFRQRLLELRREKAHDDLRWGFTELRLTPTRRMIPDAAWVF